MSTYCIIGGGLAGAKAAETLRSNGFTGDVVVVAAEADRPYERPPLSKGVLQGTQERSSVFVHEAGWYAEHEVDLRLGRAAAALDAVEHRVTLDDGSSIDYARLLLATGSEPRRLPVPGGGSTDVLTLRDLADADRLREALAGARRLAVIGGGWIGLEVAAAARQADVHVTVLEAAGEPLSAVMGATVGEIFADIHRQQGVDLHLDTQVSRIEPGAVISADDTAYEADVIVMGVGAAPRTALAEAAGISVDNGVTVDAGLAASAPDVFAAGDVANAFHPRYSRHIRTEHWANALNGGQAAARAMLGEKVTYDRLPYFYSDQYDVGIEYVGWADAARSEVVIRGDVAGRSFQAFWLKEGIVDAAMHMNMWDDGADPLKEVVALQRPVDPVRLADPSVALRDL